MIRLSFLFLLLFLCATATFGQSTQRLDCGADLVRQQRMATDSLYRKFVTRMQSRARVAALPDPNTVFTIPVVFVVYNLGEPVGTDINVSDAQIQATLERVNRSYRTYGTRYVGPDSKIQFALAQQLPSCTATNGIIRVNASSLSNYSTGGVLNKTTENAIRRLIPEFSNFEAHQFVIVRIVKNVMPPYAGFAYFGGDVFIDYKQINANADDDVLAHELGHVLSLLHTFQGSESSACPNDPYYPDGDGVSDTPPHAKTDLNCYLLTESSTNPCTSQPYGTVLHNYMSYTYNTCKDRFTQGQVDRMRTFLADEFPSLLSSNALTSPSPGASLVAASCSITTGNTQTGYGIEQFVLNTINNNQNTSAYYWAGATELHGYYNDYSCSYRTSLQAGVNYPIQVISGSDNKRLYIDYNNDGSFDENTELAYSGTSGIGTITIPTNTVQNTYLRLRVVTDSGMPTACYLPGNGTDGIGEIEDYAVLIQPAPQLIANLNGATFCAGTATSVDITTNGLTVGAGNMYTIQLSDAGGSFASPVTIGSGSASPVSVTFPAGSAPGTTYQIRALASQPATTGVAGATFTIKAIPTATMTGTQTITSGQSAQLSVTFTGELPYSFTYLANGGSPTSMVNIPVSTFNFSVSPTSTTTYSLLSVSSSCSVTKNGTPIVTVNSACSPPTNVTAQNVTATSFQPVWQAVGGYSYVIRYRVNGATGWTQGAQISVATTGQTTATLAGLTNGLTYEWQIKTICSGGNESNFSGSIVTTTSCQPPVLSISGVNNTTALATWSTFGVPATFTLQWRVLGSSTSWNMAMNFPGPTFQIAGLQPGTPYEIQIKTVCTDGSSSGFSASQTFTTQGTCTAMHSLKSGTWTDPTVWSCNRIPTSNDVIKIMASHLVMIPGNTTGYAQTLQQFGRLGFGTGARLLLGSAIDLTKGLVAYYSFTGNASDASGNSNHGIVTGATLTTNRQGTANSAYEFGGFGSATYIQVNNSPTLQFTNTLTISLWYSLNTYAGMNGNGANVAYGMHTLFAKEADWGGFYSRLLGEPDNDIARIDFGNTSSGFSPYAPLGSLASNLNIWTHLTYVVSPSQIRIYKNGIPHSTTTLATPPNFTTANAKNLYFGKYGGNNWYPLNGKLDDIRIYNRALTDSEVQALYNASN